MIETILITGLSAAGTGLIVRKLFSTKIQHGEDANLFSKALTCDVCTAWWMTLVVIALGMPFYTLPASTALAAIMLRIYTRLDPGPSLELFLDEDRDEEKCNHGRAYNEKCGLCSRHPM